MLKALRRIFQEISSVQSLDQAFDIVVKRIVEVIDTQFCGVFLTDNETGEYVLIAADGLKKTLVGKVRLKLGEGLVGLVGEREAPINLDDATQHANFRHYPEIDKQAFRAFLGVPIIHQRQVLGVLVVQKEDAVRFDEAEEAFLVTLSVQLAAVTAEALATGKLPAISRKKRTIKKQKPPAILSGIPSSPGVAIGTAVVVYPLADLAAVPEREVKDKAAQTASFKAALKAAKSEIKRLSDSLKTNLATEKQTLFEAYSLILDSASLSNEIIAEIKAGNWAQGALKNVIQGRIRQFEAMDDPYLRERASDLKDLGQRILAHLQARERSVPNYPQATILVGEEITPAALAEVPEGYLAGVVSIKGSSNSHVAILARALGVPTVMGIGGTLIALLDKLELVVDGYNGEVHVSPSKVVRGEFLRLAKEERLLDEELESLREFPAETEDGHKIALYVNTGLAADVSCSLTVGAEGVGLYRTEVPFMIRDRFPTEEEQRVIYRQLLTAFAPRPVMIRTLDIGGDKSLPYFPIEDDNPFLGWRGIRITLDHPEIFLVQIRALLRANVGLENLHIMLPMVSNLIEVEEAMRLLSQAHEELSQEDTTIKMPMLGVMIEVPSAIYQARELARKVDFVSVGSNDLTQYLLAVDRNNARVASLYDSLHPAVLRALVDVVKSVHREKKHVGLCGEMAGDPTAVVLLLAMGFDSLSMSAMRLPRMKWVVRKFTMTRATELLKEVLDMDDANEIRNHMEMALEEAGLGGLIRAGR